MLQKIFILFSLLLVLPDLYIYRLFISRLSDAPVLKALYWFPTVLLLAGLLFLGFFAKESFFSEHTRWMGWFAVALFLCSLPKLIFVLCSLLGLPFQYALHWPRAPFTYLGLLLGTLQAGIILYGSLVGRTNFERTTVDFQSPAVPKAFDGYRIVQLSDIHIGSFDGDAASIQRAVDMVNAQKPDLIVFTGDLVNHKASELDSFQHILGQLQAPDGVYSILGNHDYGPYYRWNSPREQAQNLIELKERQAAMGWQLLNNEHVILHHNGDSIALVGVENEGEPPFSQHGDLTKALRGTEGMFQLLLSHNPTHWRREVLPQSEVDLMLAGHTHAMQLALGRHSLSSLIYPEWGGLYTADQGRALHINIGLGFVGLPFRFGAWPEITLITLRKGK